MADKKTAGALSETTVEENLILFAENGRKVRKFKSEMYIYDKDYRTIVIPTKTTSGTTIYGINKILKKLKKDENLQRAVNSVIDTAGDMLKPYLSPEGGEGVTQMLQRAMWDAFNDGKMKLSEMNQLTADLPEPDAEVGLHNDRVMIEVFTFIIDDERIADAALLAELTDVTNLQCNYPHSVILKVVQDFMTLCGMKSRL